MTARAVDVVLPSGNLKRIHVNQFKIRDFHKKGLDQPCWIVRTSGGVYHCRSWEIVGDATGIQSLAKPMPGCSARVWIETRAEVHLRQAQAEVDSCTL